MDPRLSQASLRNRLILLLSTYSMARGESLIMAELSDLMSVNLPMRNANSLNPKDALVLVFRIGTGKTNGDNTLYGRTIRNRNLYSCSIGALGLYLVARFEIAREVLDFSSNEMWFDRKLLVSNGSSNPNDSIKEAVGFFNLVIHKSYDREL